MSLINSAIIPGLLLALVPVILHLVMRAKPKRIEFPALMLIRKRQTANARRLQLRQLILLLLRILLIVVVVVAIARPSLPAANYGLRWWEWLAVLGSAGLSLAIWRWLSRRDDRNPSQEQQRRREIRKLVCLAGGVAGALLFAALPWGLRVRAELLSPHSEASENIPVAAVFVVDTSVSMKYRHENRTRLEAAAEVAVSTLRRFPVNSRAAVTGLGPDDEIIFQADLAGAASRLESMEVTTVPRLLNHQLKAAIEAQVDDRKIAQEQAGTGGTSDLYAREIYLLSDFSKAAWQIPDESGIADLLALNDWLQIYLVDVSVAQPVNSAIRSVELSEETTVAGRDVLLTLGIESTVGLSELTTVEASLISASGEETRVGAPALVRLDGNAAQVQTSVRIPAGQPFVEGVVRLSGEDPLPDDNVRYFSCGVKPVPNVLLISDRIEESRYLRNALQPEDLELAGVKLCQCTTVATANVAGQNFSQFDVVCLINVQRPDETLWSALLQYAESGGGVFVVAGSQRIQPTAWSGSGASQILPATPLTVIRFLNEPGQLQLELQQHPVVHDFAAEEQLRVELLACAFDRCWAVEPVEGSTVLFRFTGPANRPALLERRVGNGRCLMFVSAMDNLTDGGSQWNNLPASWSFLVLTDQILQYLTGSSDVRRNFTAGETIDIPVPSGQRFEQFLLRRPGLRQTRSTLAADQPGLLLSDVNEPGHYLVRPFESPSAFQAAFSVNSRGEETDLTRVPDEQLQSVCGEHPVRILHDAQQLERAVVAGRIGIEVFPVLLGLLLVLFCGEHLLANFFYEAPAESTGAAAP